MEVFQTLYQIFFAIFDLIQYQYMIIRKISGVTNSNVIASATIKNKADISIVFDGDDDSLLLWNKFWKFLDGDHILAIFEESFGLSNSEILSTFKLWFWAIS